MLSTWAIVPIKPFNRAKSRLAVALPPEVREHLAAAMLRRTVSLLVACSEITGVLVVSRDNRALVIARQEGARTVQESGAPELNNALARAGQVVNSWGARASLILPADLPLLTMNDIREMIHLGRYHRSIVIAPDRRGEGTNALLMRPPCLIPCAFGGNSFGRHMQLAQEAAATLHVFRSERLMLDLDTPDDLIAYLELCKKYSMEPLADFAPVQLLPVAPTSHQENAP